MQLATAMSDAPAPLPPRATEHTGALTPARRAAGTHRDGRAPGNTGKPGKPSSLLQDAHRTLPNELSFQEVTRWKMNCLPEGRNITTDVQRSEGLK